MPDNFNQIAGSTGRIGLRVVHYSYTRSTMDTCREMAAEGGEEGLVVVADAQSAGRGRHGRAWVSKPGENLLLSVLLRPRPAIARELLILASLAAAETARHMTGTAPTIKWPNDVRVDGRKLCGVLAESVTRPDSGALEVVIGIGLNVNMDPSVVEEVIPPPTSLRALVGRPVSRVETLRVLLSQMSSMYEALLSGATLLPEWKALLETVGQNVTVRVGDPERPDREVTGLAEDVDESGRLMVRDADGYLWAMAAGEVTLARAAVPPA